MVDAAGGAGEGGPKPPNLLFVLVDSLRADQVSGDARGSVTPVLDSLVARGTLFEKAFATASMTTVSVASILSGTYPFVHGVRSLSGRSIPSQLQLLPEAFKAAGYHTWAEVTGPLLPITGCDRGFDDYRYREFTEWLDTPFGDRLVRRLRSELPGPWFGLLHLWEVHYPRRVTARFNRRRYGRNLYERAVSSLDHQLGRIADALPPETVVLVTGDHGEYVAESRRAEALSRLKRATAFLKRYVPGYHAVRRTVMSRVMRSVRSGGHQDSDLFRAWIGHGFHVYDPLLHVPLVISGGASFPPGRRIADMVSHVDLYPTLASAFGLLPPPDGQLRGLDLMPLVRGQSPGLGRDAIYVEACGARLRSKPEQWLQGLRTERHKYAQGLVSGDIPVELYDLMADPAERHNVAAAHPEVVDRMRARLAEIVDGAANAQPADGPSWSPQELEEVERRLRELGYID